MRALRALILGLIEGARASRPEPEAAALSGATVRGKRVRGERWRSGGLSEPLLWPSVSSDAVR